MFKYNDRVEIIREGFYKGVVGHVIREIPHKDYNKDDILVEKLGYNVKVEGEILPDIFDEDELRFISITPR